jgi:hypothetical protein
MPRSPQTFSWTTRFLIVADQAAINAGFEFRRYAMKPTPAKPRTSIAHVEGSAGRHFAFVPNIRHAQLVQQIEASQKKSGPRRRLFNSNMMIDDQAAINAGFDFRR